MRKYAKKFIVLHHSLTPRDTTTFVAVNRYHQEKWNFVSSLGFYCGYHYFIEANGQVTQARADFEVGAHCSQRQKNFDGLGICLAGNFDLETPSQAQLDALKSLIELKMAEHKISRINLRFHRDFAKYKSCPGKNINADFWEKLLNN
jgi:N-acetylmuramoyl-L-alanine amidase